MKKKLLLPLALLLVAFSAHAEWVKVAWTSGATNYVDVASIKKNGSLRQFIQMIDLKELHEKQFMSIRTDIEANCDERKIRSLGGKAYKGPMGGGDFVLFIPDSDWYEVPPKSAAEAQLEFVCKG